MGEQLDENKKLHPPKTFSHGGVVLTKLINLGEKMQPHVKSFIKSIFLNAIMWGLIFLFFQKFIL